MDPQVLLRLGIALGLGLLVGLQRELVKTQVAGLRTFALITLLGGFSALFADWLVAVTLALVALTLAMGNYLKARNGTSDPGATTEIAAMVMVLVGATVVRGMVVLGMAVGAVVAVLLYEKPRLQAITERIGDEDLRAILRLVVIALVILPLLPDRTFGPYDVLNPHQVWWMVVLIVAIGLSGYVAFRLLGPRAGGVASGVLGGLVSSTATTLAWARHARASARAVALATVVVMLASAVVYVRLLVEIAVVAPSFLGVAAPRLGVMVIVSAALSGLLFLRVRPDDHFRPEPSNPAELRGAIVFALLYAAVLLLVAWVRDQFGSGALYFVAFASGLTDMDAITLSTSRLVEQSRLDADLAWRLILVASLANLVFKGAIVAVVGGRALGLRVGAVFGVAVVAGLIVLGLG